MKRARRSHVRTRATAGIDLLEPRRHFCADGLGEGHALPWQSELRTALDRNGVDHTLDWYAPAAAASLPGETPAAGPITFSTNAAGLPLLTSRGDGQGLKVFLDFDGNGTNLPFGIDTDDATFNVAEQQAIYDTWRDMVSYFSPLNVNITTVQPPTGASDPNFAWHLTSKSISGGYAYVGVLSKSGPFGFNQSNNAQTRRSGIAHEIGHLLALQHQSEFDKLGTKTSEYTDGWDVRNRSVIGIDFNENVRKWFNGRSSSGSTVIQDDLQTMANKVATVTGGDGYRPDDHGNTLALATAVPNGVGQLGGILERATDVDTFTFTSTSDATWQFAATPVFESAASPKLELLDSAGNLLYARDDADQRNQNNNNVEFATELPAGTYYVSVTTHGDYGDQGEYLLTASPLLSGWRSQDVNTVYRPGAVAYDPASGQLQQLGGGLDISGTSDQFRFTSNVLTGDGTIIARMDGFEGANSSIDATAKTGLMIRQSLAVNSAFAMISRRPAGAVDFLTRATAGGSVATSASGTSSGPVWLKLSRAGNAFTVQQSTDGITWVNVGGAVTISMTGPVYIGFATTSRSNRAAAIADYSNISVSGTLGAATPTFNALPTPTGLSAAPAPGANTSIVLNWADVVGETGYAIDRSVDGINFSQLTTVAANVVTYTDANPFGSMRWFYRIAALSSATRSAPSAVVNTVNKPNRVTNPPASYALPAIAASTSTIALNWSDVTGDNGYRIERSTDGVTFTPLATTAPNVIAYNNTGLPQGTVYTYRISPISAIGDGVTQSLTTVAGTRWSSSAMIVTSRTNNSVSLAWADFGAETGYRVERSSDKTTWATAGTTAADVRIFTDAARTALTEYYYRVVALAGGGESYGTALPFSATLPASSLPLPWQSTDIGAVGGGGAAGLAASTFTLIGAGAEIGGTTDEFQFAYRPLIGDGSITARVATQENTNTLAKAGVMIRESLTANSRYAFTYVQPSNTNGLDFDSRLSTGGSSVRIDGPATQIALAWVRLTRAGNLITSSWSTDGATWSTIGSQTIALSTTSPVYVGMAVTSRDDTILNTSSFDNVKFVGALTGSSTGFAVDTAPGTLGIRFNANVSASLDASDFGVKNLTTGDTLSASSLRVTWNAADLSASLSPLTGTFADGNYSVMLAAGAIADVDGNSLVGTVTDNFFVLAGDANRDRKVDTLDFNRLIASFGGVNPVFTQGNFNYDTRIDSADFNVLVTQFGKELPAPAPGLLPSYSSPFASPADGPDWTDLFA